MSLSGGGYSLSQPLSSQSSSTTIGFGMIDKLDTLRSHGRHSTVDDSIPVISPLVEDNAPEINQMLRMVNELTIDINEVEQLIQKIAHNHTAIMSSFQNETARKENEELHMKVKDIAHHVTDELKRMKQALDKDGTGPERNSADYRIRKAQYSTISRRFRDVMMQYNKEEDDYREKNKDKIQRQLKIAKQDVSEEKLEEMLESENPQTFTQSILGDAAISKRRVLSEVEARHMEIIRLEENIKELHDMFYDLAQLVYEQGDMINNIEYNIERAGNYTERAVQEVRIARDYKSKNNRLKLVICCVVTTVIIVIVVAIIIAAGIAAVIVMGQVN